jgi:hypothetical protein
VSANFQSGLVRAVQAVCENGRGKKMGTAAPTYFYLLNKQTGPGGEVLYGRPIPYRAIAKERNVPARTIRRHIAKLRWLEEIATERWREANSFRILIQVKFKSQGSIKFPTPEPIGFPVKELRSGAKNGPPPAADRKLSREERNKQTMERVVANFRSIWDKPGDGNSV